MKTKPDKISIYDIPVGIKKIIRTSEGWVKDIEIRAIKAGYDVVELTKRITGIVTDILSTKDLHSRKHQITDALDHAAATGDDKGKIVASNPSTGAIEFIPKSTFTQVQSDWDSVSGVSEILNKPTLEFGNLKSDGSVTMDYGVEIITSAVLQIIGYNTANSTLTVQGNQTTVFLYGSSIKITDSYGVAHYIYSGSTLYSGGYTTIVYEGSGIPNLTFPTATVVKIQAIPEDYSPNLDLDIATKRYVDNHFFFIPAGEKSSAVDPGTFGEASLSDDYLFLCVKTGTAGNAIWKKTSLHQT